MWDYLRICVSRRYNIVKRVESIDLVFVYRFDIFMSKYMLAIGGEATMKTMQQSNCAII